MESQVAAVGRETDYVDERFEFDAPRYHNFEVTTTSSEENTVDAWFSSSATKRK